MTVEVIPKKVANHFLIFLKEEEPTLAKDVWMTQVVTELMDVIPRVLLAMFDGQPESPEAVCAILVVGHLEFMRS